MAGGHGPARISGRGGLAIASCALLATGALGGVDGHVECSVEVPVMEPGTTLNASDLTLHLPEGYVFHEARFDVVNESDLQTGIFESFGVPSPLTGSPGALQGDNTILGIVAQAPEDVELRSVPLYGFRWFTTEFEPRTIVFRVRLEEVLARDESGVVVPVAVEDALCGWSVAGSHEDCVADWNGDTAVDIFDVLDFLRDFESEDPSTDVNGDGEFDIFDVLDFLEIWGDSCP